MLVFDIPISNQNSNGDIF